MKKLLLAAAVIFVCSSSAQASDLAARPYTKAPIAAQVYDWTGFYFGANVGVGVARDPGILNISVNGATPANTLGPIGAIGGGQIGYNWQWSNWVLGLETDLQASGMRDSNCTIQCQTPPAGSFTPSQRLEWFGTARIRAGLATGPVLTYFTGGLAYGGVNTTSAGFIGAPFPTVTVEQTKTGWTIGSGVEASLGGNWTGKIEYLYLDLGNQIVANTAVGAPANYSVDIREHVFRAGVNYRIAGERPYASGPITNWTGFYAGLNAGYGIGRNESSFGAAATTIDRFTLTPRGYLGGGQAGYNWQASNWVFGVETDLQGSALRDSDNCLFGCTTISRATIDQRMNWFGTARGRVGYSLGSTLFYGTGGLAYGEIRNRVTAIAPPNPTFQADATHVKAGFAAGGGIESPLDLFGLFGRNWTVKTEYLYVDLGSVNDSFAIPAFGGASFTLNTQAHEHIFRSGINYHFNSPVVARY